MLISRLWMTCIAGVEFTFGTTILPCGLISLLVNTFSNKTDAPMASQELAPGSVLAASAGSHARLPVITHKLSLGSDTNPERKMQ